jgi:hypothetical protein
MQLACQTFFGNRGLERHPRLSPVAGLPLLMHPAANLLTHPVDHWLENGRQLGAGRLVRRILPGAVDA